MKYRPKHRRKGLKVPFGYFLNPADPEICLPDEKKLDALHYAFRMRAQHKTPFRDITMWLHAATGDKLSAHGFMYMYNAWLNRLAKARKKEIAAKKAELNKIAQETFKDFVVKIDDERDITAVAYKQATDEIQIG